MDMEKIKELQIQKLKEAEQRADKALALGIGIFLGYEPTSVCGICEMYYILRKWQAKHCLNELKGLDALIEDYDISFKAVNILDEMDGYVALRQAIDKASDKESNIESAFTNDQEGTATMPEIMKIMAQCHENPEAEEVEEPELPEGYEEPELPEGYEEPETPEDYEASELPKTGMPYVYPIWNNPKGPLS